MAFNTATNFLATRSAPSVTSVSRNASGSESVMSLSEIAGNIVVSSGVLKLSAVSLATASLTPRGLSGYSTVSGVAPVYNVTYNFAPVQSWGQ